MDKELSLTITTGGGSQAVSISSTSAQSAAITASSVLVCVTAACFVRRGSNPTALSNGTDQYLPADTLLRIDGWSSGEKLAFVTTGATGSAYITPGA